MARGKSCGSDHIKAEYLIYGGYASIIRVNRPVFRGTVGTFPAVPLSPTFIPLCRFSGRLASNSLARVQLAQVKPTALHALERRAFMLQHKSLVSQVES